jgi:hypothetical protein
MRRAHHAVRCRADSPEMCPLTRRRLRHCGIAMDVASDKGRETATPVGTKSFEFLMYDSDGQFGDGVSRPV